MLISKHKEIDFWRFPNKVTEEYRGQITGVSDPLFQKHKFRILMKIRQDSVIVTDDTGVK